MSTRGFFIVVCLLLAGSIILAAVTPVQQAFLLDNVAMLVPAEPSPPPPTVPPIGPYSQYAPVIFDTVSTPVIQPTPTATLEGEPTDTVAPPPTVPPTEEPG
jgi:hypothetical protein